MTQSRNGFAVLGLLTIALVSPIGSKTTGAQQGLDSTAAFDSLKRLVGTWEAIDKANPSRSMAATYSLTGGGSVLMEELKGNTSSVGGMSTAYHLDKGQLVLTHFCGAGNQPRMRVTSIKDGGRTIAFEMYDITNLANPQGYRSTTLEVALLSDDRVELAYGGMTAGRNSTQVFQLTRKPR